MHREMAAPQDTPPDDVMDEVEEDEDEDEDEDKPLEKFEKNVGSYKFCCEVRDFYCFWYPVKDVKSLNVYVREEEGGVIATLEGYLIGRHGWKSNFYHDCDVTSNELQDMAITLFHQTGRLRKDSWPMLSPKAIQRASYGGFLTIEMVKVEETHRGKDVGHQCVRYLFECMKGRWTFSVLLLTYYDDIQEKKHQIYQFFTRFGYQQNIRRRHDYWFLTPNRLISHMTKEGARNITFNVHPEFEWYEEEEKKVFRSLIYFDDRRKLPFEKVEVASAVKELQVSIRESISGGLDINGSGFAHIAAFRCGPILLTALLKEGADPNYQGVQGATPLHWACDSGCVECIEVLLEQPGIDLHVVDKYCQTPYHRLLHNLEHKRRFRSHTVNRETEDQYKKRYALCFRLMPDAVKSIMVEGLMSPIMLDRLNFAASFHSNNDRLDMEDYDKDRPPTLLLQSHPKEITSKSVGKRFATGFYDILQYICVLLDQGKLPTASRVLKLCSFSSRRSYQHYLQRGGKMEYCFLSLIGCLEDQSWENGDAEEDEFENDELEKLPKVEGFDGNFDYMKTYLLDYLVNN